MALFKDSSREFDLTKEEDVSRIHRRFMCVTLQPVKAYKRQLNGMFLTEDFLRILLFCINSLQH